MEQSQKQSPQENEPQNNVSIRVGILSSNVYREDLMFYNEIFRKTNEVFGDAVKFVVFGYDGREDMPELFNGVRYEYHKPVSIIHYFKKLKSLNLDVVFVPLINNTYNATSENYNKYLEAASFKIPLVVTDIAPYNRIIINNKNGFLYKDKSEMVEVFRYLLTNSGMVRHVGQAAYQDLIDNFNYDDENIEVISQTFKI